METQQSIGLTIGSNSVLGSGSVLTKSIPENEVWYGNRNFQDDTRQIRGKEVSQWSRIEMSSLNFSKIVSNTQTRVSKENYLEAKLSLQFLGNTTSNIQNMPWQN